MYAAITVNVGTMNLATGTWEDIKLEHQDQVKIYLLNRGRLDDKEGRSIQLRSRNTVDG